MPVRSARAMCSLNVSTAVATSEAERGSTTTCGLRVRVFFFEPCLFSLCLWTASTTAFGRPRVHFKWHVSRFWQLLLRVGGHVLVFRQALEHGGRAIGSLALPPRVRTLERRVRGEKDEHALWVESELVLGLCFKELCVSVSGWRPSCRERPAALRRAPEDGHISHPIDTLAHPLHTHFTPTSQSLHNRRRRGAHLWHEPREVGERVAELALVRLRLAMLVGGGELDACGGRAVVWLLSGW